MTAAEVLALIGVWRDARSALHAHRRIAGNEHGGHGKAKCTCWCYDTDAEECEIAEALKAAEFASAEALARLAPVEAVKP